MRINKPKSDKVRLHANSLLQVTVLDVGGNKLLDPGKYSKEVQSYLLDPSPTKSEQNDVCISNISPKSSGVRPSPPKYKMGARGLRQQISTRIVHVHATCEYKTCFGPLMTFPM